MNNTQGYKLDINHAPHGIFVSDTEGRFYDVNSEACSITGYKREELLSMSLFEILPDNFISTGNSLTEEFLSKVSQSKVVEYFKLDGEKRLWEINKIFSRDDEIFIFIKDITEDNRIKNDLQSRLALEKIISSFSSRLTIVDPCNIDNEINKAFTLLGPATCADRIYFFTYSNNFKLCSNLYEWCSGGVTPQIENLQNINTDYTPWWFAKMNADESIMFENIEMFPPEAYIEKGILSDQGIKSIAIIPSFYNGRLKGFFGFDSVKEKRSWNDEDIYLLRMAGNALCNSIVRVQEQKERQRLEEQMASVQRLESIGKLAGGVAHDFNNIVQAISGFAELAVESEGESQLTYLDEIKNASLKASELTGQLLAFARKQPVFPRSLDLNSSVEKSIKMLESLIKGKAELVLKVEEDLWPVVIDPSQIDQIVTNLIINSRDAVSENGEIIIETYNKDINSEYCNSNAAIIPGKYSVLAISDNGCGMDKKTESHIFEPFYTTKKTAGTGLGLSTVYGIVKQNGGFITVDSEEGIGTTFKVYLKKGNQSFSEKNKTPVNGSVLSDGVKTILVVECEVSILILIKKVLENANYKIFTAGCSDEAFSEVEKHSDDIDLLLTAVVLPGMNGKQINEKIREMIPDIQTIYMSGYAANIIENKGVINEGINFLQKPFSIPDLLEKVSALLR